MAGKDLKPRRLFLLSALLTLLFFFSCSFDYGNKEQTGNEQPDIVMEDVEYVRVRGGDPVVRFQAELAERFEEKQTMNLRQFTFEQFEKNGEEIDARGSAVEAQVELESGNIQLNGGVTISVDSEDITIQTSDLKWQDKEKLLAGSPAGIVDIQRSDGTGFSGKGFSADVRSRTWNFDAGASGFYVDEDEEDGGNEGEPPTEDYEFTAAETPLTETGVSPDTEPAHISGTGADNESPRPQKEAVEK